tara:strand:+ start:265 stop:4356 length:4092 start_codon:yes stop_codon:yes gene_type:complete
MAENSKVFVSPGVYTAEKDLTFVAQSVGVTTLGVAGETKKGPAFEPILIDSFDKFRTRFGDTDPEKFTDTQIPKYEASFIARSYLSQSNQLFITRVLGLSGYDAGPSWQLLTIGELDPLYVAQNSTANTATGWSKSVYIPLTGGTINTSNIYASFSTGLSFSDALSGATPATNLVGGTSGPFRTTNQITGETMYNGNGSSVGTLVDDIAHFTNNVLNNNQSSFNITGATEFYYYGFVPTACTTTAFPTITANTGLPVDVYDRLGIASDLGPGSDGAGATYPEAINSADFSGDTNDGWFGSLFDYQNNSDYPTCTNSCYSGGSFAMYASSASTASTYVTGATSTGVSGSSDNVSPSNEYAILQGIIAPQATTHITNINEYTGCTSATSWSEWSFYGAAVGNDQTDDGIAKIDNYYSYSGGVSGWTSSSNGGGLVLSAYQPTVYPFVGSVGTGSTLSGAVLTRTAAQYSGAVSDYSLNGSCAGTSIGGSSPAYTAVQVTLSGFSAPDDGSGFIHGLNSNVMTNGGAVVTSLSGISTTNVNWFSGTGLSAFTTFYTGSCSAVTYLAMTLSGCYSTYNCVSADTNYHNMTIATLRSRGESTLTSGGPTYKISASTGDGYKQGDVAFDCGGTYEDILRDPFANFGLSAKTDEGVISKFTASLDTSKKNYISRVLGGKVFDRDSNEIPIFVGEIYPNLLKYLYRRQKIRGINCCLCYLPAARFNNTNRTSLGWYMNEWQTPATPYIVSELRGNEVSRLFRFISISDGTAANREHKISITNISFERVEFDVMVRDFYDTDANPIVLEKYTRCTLDPSAPNFIARKIGTSDGEYELKSIYTMLEITDAVVDGDLKDALPAGFEGYKFRESCTSTINPYPKWKTKYFTPGEVVFDPYFDSNGVSNASVSAGDNIRKNYLGFSNGDGAAIDYDFFEYKGFKTPTAVCTDTTGSDWPTLTQGFHMDSGATVVIAGSGSYLTETASTLSGKSMFMAGAASFQSEPTSTTDPYYKLAARKFTLVPYGGFDGWDEYRKSRSNQDVYRLGMTGYKYGACADSTYTDASGLGSFKKISTTESNTDYDAYRQAIHKFENPEAVDINLFATPGVDYVNNLALVNDSIDMVETERADSLYITTTPDYNLFVTTTSDANNKIDPTEAVNNMEDSFIDSNYTATYYPWVLVRDNNTNKQLYVPPTAEVARNMALTDNIAFPWFASAGYTRGVVDAIKARTKLTLEERDTLYVGRLNPIATFSDVGPIIFGNKTLQVKESALDRINVRRLLLQTRKLISAVAVRLLFEQNDDVVRQQFLDLVNPILDSIRRDRGLTDFRVVLSDDPEEIDRNELNGKIYIKPTRALEFIFIEFLITPTGASFEDI